MSTYWHIDPDEPYEPIDNVEGQAIWTAQADLDATGSVKAETRKERPF